MHWSAGHRPLSYFSATFPGWYNAIIYDWYI